jgi:STE24 endopeptidase
MQIVFIIIICVACMPFDERNLVGDPSVSLMATMLGMIVAALAAEAPARWFTWKLRRWPSHRWQVVRDYNHWRLLHFGLLLGIYAVSRLCFGWGHVVRSDWQFENVVIIDKVLVLAPLLTTLVLSWLSFYRVELALYETSSAYGVAPFWTGSEYLLFHLRHDLGLALTAVLLLVGIPDAVHGVAPNLEKEEWYPLVSVGIFLGGAVLLMPWLLTIVWSTRSLPAGPLRDRLEAVARRLGFRYTDIRLWNTYGGLANAMVTGILPFPRYVLLSDQLIQNLTVEQIEAVFGHEIGHVKHFHMPLYLSFFMLSVCILMLAFAAGQWISADVFNAAVVWEDFARPGSLSQTAAAGGLSIGYFWLVFGFLSRRCERQADVYGCKAVAADGFRLSADGIRTFISALERVADLNGIRRDRHSWLHSSIARRVAFLESLLTDPQQEHHFQRRLAVIKWSLFLGLLTVTAVCGQTFGWSLLLQ